MSSLLSNYDLSTTQIARFLRGYEHTMPVSPEQWAEAECLGLGTGTLIICLEKFSPTEGLESPTFRTTELSIIVGQTNERPIAITLSDENYGLAFLETVMSRNANKAKENKQDFFYLLAEAWQMIPADTLKEIEVLGHSFAGGGSRAERKPYSADPIDPAISLLSAMGLSLDSSMGKKLLDVHQFCYLLFQDSGNEVSMPLLNVGSVFRPISRLPVGQPGVRENNEHVAQAQPEIDTRDLPQASDARGKEELKDNLKITLGLGGIFSTIAEANPARKESSPKTANLMQMWDPDPEPETETESQDLDRQDSESQSQDLDRQDSESQSQDSDRQVSESQSQDSDRQDSESQSQDLDRQGSESQSQNMDRQGSKSQLQDLDRQDSESQSQDLDRQGSKSQSESKSPQSLLEEMKPNPLAEALPVVATDKPAPEPKPTFREARASDTVTKSRAGSPSKFAYQESTSMSGAMESLVNKLEQQVNKASAKLLNQLDQMRAGLDNELQQLLQKAADAEQKDEVSFMSALAKIFKSLDEYSEESRLRLSDTAATGRYSIKQLLEGNKSTINDRQSSRLSTLLSLCKQIEQEQARSSQDGIDKVTSLIKSKTSELSELVNTICKQIGDVNEDYSQSLSSRFERAKKRLTDETEFMERSAEHLISSLNDDLTGICDRACGKLKSGQREYQTTLRQSVQAWQLDLSLLVKFMMGTALLPKLRECEQNLTALSHEMVNSFAQQYEEHAARRHSELDTVALDLNQQQHRSGKESFSLLESVLNEQQLKLKEMFSCHKEEIERISCQAAGKLHEIESQIEQSERATRNLVESSTTSDVDLIACRDTTVARLQDLKKQCVKDLLSATEQQCDQLSERAQTEQAKLTASKENCGQSMQEESRLALSQMRDALQEAFESIEQTREKHLE